MVPTTTSLTRLEHLLLLKDLTFTFYDNCLIFYNSFSIVNAFLCVTVIYLYM